MVKMSQHLFALSSAPLERVNRVSFGVLSPEETTRYSVAEINHQETYENRKPKPGGLLDPHMGCVDQDTKCLTCDEMINQCVGHFGHLVLARPVFHIGFLAKVKKLLETVCTECSALRIPYSIESGSKYQILVNLKRPKDRFKFAWDNSKQKNVCEIESCRRRLFPIRKVGNKLYMEKRRSTTGREVLGAARVREILAKISDNDCKALGMNPNMARPEWMILTVLPVPPPCIRPSISMESSGRGEDDLTHKLSDIIKYNNNIKKLDAEHTSHGVPRAAPTDNEEQLQYHITAYIDNENSGNPPSLQKTGKLTKSLQARLKGKEGRLRGNLQGKRVDHAARTVITGDPNLDIDQVGVPQAIARNLTIPERVFMLNKEKLQRLVNNGSVYPGAKYVFTKTGRTIDLRYSKTHPVLCDGDVVERHLVDDDMVLFNRQPTLHKPSAMGHRVKVMPFSTFRLNLSVTTPYNADFDGDEMNAHVAQTLETIAELKILSGVPSMILSAQSSKPVMGIVQDALCGVRKLTLRDTFFDKAAAMNLLMQLDDFDGVMPLPCITKPKQLWSGKQLFSMLLPAVDLVTYHSTHPDDEKTLNSPGDTRVQIDGGTLTSGIVCKRTVGTSSGGLIHVICKDFGEVAVAKFMNDCQRLVNQYLLHHGFSVGLGDSLVDVKQKTEAEAMILENVEKASHLSKPYNVSLEPTITKILNSARDSAGKLVQKHLSKDNNLKQMVVAGSKGNAINMTQITACVGQQNVEGKRIPFGFQDRTLPHFKRFDHSPMARGFVESSYRKGLTPTEFFCHAMGGREGLIDTAVKTAETGYIQRRLVKALEDVVASYDGTVRNSRGDISQFSYGEDKLDGASLEKQRLFTLFLSDAEMRQKYQSAKGENEGEVSMLLADRDFLRTVFTGGEDTVAMAVNVKRLLRAAQRSVLTEEGNAILDWRYVVKGVETLNNQLRERHGEYCRLFNIFLRMNLSSAQVMKAGLTTSAFAWVLRQISSKYEQAFIQPGEMVGVLAAQSIGEPATQMTLNTFHVSCGFFVLHSVHVIEPILQLAGVSNKNVTLGIPRLKELINTVKNIKTPSMALYLSADVSKDRAPFIKSRIEHTTLRDVVAETFILRKADDPVADEAWTRFAYPLALEAASFSQDELSPWMMRLCINREKLWVKGMGMCNVRDSIQEALGENALCISSDDNNDPPTIHVRIRESMEENTVPDDHFMKLTECALMDLTLCGISGVRKAFVETKPATIFSDSLLGGEAKMETEVCVETEGINIQESFQTEGVDPYRTVCNDPAEMLHIFGVEAARETLLREIRSVIQFDGGQVSYRHLALLVDVMTNRGNIMSITRHGINRTDAGPLMKCSFEETNDILFSAAADCETDYIRGVAENVMLGLVAPMGTGTFDVLLDERALKSLTRH